MEKTFEPVSLPEGYAFDSSGGSPSKMVALFHGYGSCGFDLIGLVPYLSGALEECYWYAPNGLQPRQSFGYQWFEYNSEEPEILGSSLAESSSAIESFLDRRMSLLNLSPSSVCLVGFSQGGMVALDLAARNSFRCAVSFSGAFISNTSNASRTPLCLVHGKEDQVVEFSSMERSAAKLQSLGFPVTCHAIEGLGHSIDMTGIRFAREFISSCFAN